LFRGKGLTPAGAANAGHVSKKLTAAQIESKLRVRPASDIPALRALVEGVSVAEPAAAAPE